eukprot:gene30628-35640_t
MMHTAITAATKSFLGLVQSAPARLEIEFKNADGTPYTKTAVVKSKGTETEEVPLFTNKDCIQGEAMVVKLKRTETEEVHLFTNKDCIQGEAMVVKLKRTETEEVHLFTNKDCIQGEAMVVKLKRTETEEVHLFTNKDCIQGEILVAPMTAKKFEHLGIKVQLLGQIELASERGKFHQFLSLELGKFHQFLSLALPLGPPADAPPRSPNHWVAPHIPVVTNIHLWKWALKSADFELVT